MKSKYRWTVVIIFFVFMLVHQTDKLLINPIAPQIYDEYNLSDTQWGTVSTSALIVGAVFYPLWGYFYDRFARGKLIALASLIWGSTTWFSAIAPNFSVFLLSRASTGIDDSSYPGLYSLVADYFEPKTRGKIYGLLQLTQPLGYLIGLILATTVAVSIGWRNIFFITGGLGILLAVIIFLFIKDIPRGNAEPEFESVENLGKFKFEWAKVKDVLKKKSLILMNLQGFFGLIPWNAIVAFIFIYLAEERGYAESEILFTMAPAILILAMGYPMGGALGDLFFKKNKKGRILVSFVGVITGALFLYITLKTPVGNTAMFGIMMALTALFIPISSPNVTATVNDVALPEIRSTALSIQYFIESGGAALSPFLTGIISDSLRRINNPRPLETAILIICISAWALCGIIYFITTRFIVGDIDSLRAEMRKRAASSSSGNK
jgi:MFS family permease